MGGGLRGRSTGFVTLREAWACYRPAYIPLIVIYICICVAIARFYTPLRWRGCDRRVLPSPICVCFRVPSTPYLHLELKLLTSSELILCSPTECLDHKLRFQPSCIIWPYIAIATYIRVSIRIHTHTHTYTYTYVLFVIKHNLS